MLVIRRKPGEALHLTVGQHTISITLLAVKGERVKIGIDAHKEVKIVRAELLSDGAPLPPAESESESNKRL